MFSKYKGDKLAEFAFNVNEKKNAFNFIDYFVYWNEKRNVIFM